MKPALLKRLINTPPHVYVTMLEDLHNTAQTYTQSRCSIYVATDY